MGARILVVEDNALNLKLIKDVLEFQGFDVVTARSGGKASQWRRAAHSTWS